jgi:dCTP deaminase
MSDSDFLPDAALQPLRDDHQTGLLPSHVLRALVRAGEIAAAAGVGEDQIQPASVDLRLGRIAYRVRASFLPGRDATVESRIAQFRMHEFDLTHGAVLERGCVYIVPLQEVVKLPSRISGVANPKSSTGRLDIFTRLICDRATEFERIEAGYEGPLYVEISPRAFSIVVRAGSRLNQLRLRRGSPVIGEAALRRLHEEVGLVDRPIGREERLSDGIPLSVDLSPRANGAPAGWKARKHAGLVDIDKVNAYDPAEFWEPVTPAREGGIVLDPDEFYVLASKEAVTVPPGYAAEMRAYDTFVGEFRVHYAGFFDPGFGYAGQGGSGTRAVLEVRSHEVPFRLDDGQIVGRLVYERLTGTPDKLYGGAIGSSYQRQGLQLAKQFRAAG